MSSDNKDKLSIKSDVEKWKEEDDNRTKNADKVSINLAQHEADILANTVEFYEFKSKSQALRWLIELGISGEVEIQARIDEIEKQTNAQFVQVHGDGYVEVQKRLFFIPTACRSIVEGLVSDDITKESLKAYIKKEHDGDYLEYLHTAINEYYVETQIMQNRIDDLESQSSILSEAKLSLDEKVERISRYNSELENQNALLKLENEKLVEQNEKRGLKKLAFWKK